MCSTNAKYIALVEVMKSKKYIAVYTFIVNSYIFGKLLVLDKCVVCILLLYDLIITM